MAPTAPHEKKPSARTLRHQRITGQIHPLLPSKLFRPDAAVSDSFLSSKRDKRLMKHSSFLSRVQSSDNKITKSNTKNAVRNRKRRDAKKIANLDSLGDALPDLDGAEVLEPGKVRHRSLNSKKGALKKKEMVVKGEMQRFGVSMARLAEAPAGQGAGAQTQSQTASPTENSQDQAGNAPSANRWAALRGYISATMEQNPAFAGKQ